MESQTEIAARLAFLQRPLVTSLLQTHPNRVFSSTTSFVVPSEWERWWEWASLPEDNLPEARWQSVLKAYTSLGRPSTVTAAVDLAAEKSMPPELLELARRARNLDLDRTPMEMTHASCGRENLPGMSPKKSHEVIRMTNYILDLTARPTFKDVRHIVDIGAGQGYLSRALAQVGFHVLALDGDASQTEGAERRATSKTKSHHQDKLFDNLPSSPGRGRGSLTHVTNHITPSTLNSSVSSWIHESVFTSECITPVPVLFVALHACGTLTPDIFRTFVAYHHTPTNKEDCQIPLWSPIGTAIVGCCYNLMSPDSDFPLSKAYSRFPSVTYSNLQLAAQVPSRWLDSPLSTETSIRKVAYRSLLERFVPTSASTGPSSVAASNPKKRLGRLSDSAYTSFPVFLDRASTKLGFQLPALLTVNGSSELISATAAAPPMDPGSPVFKSSQRQLEVLHVLRSILGPVIESTIILDRLAWLREALGVSRVSRAGEDVGWDVNLVGIFDQVAGSARNFAITITPSTSTNISPA